MATSTDIDIDTAVEEVLQTSLRDEDPLDCLTNTQVAEVYSRLSAPDQRLFLQFKEYHRQYYNQHGESMPSYQLARGIVRQIFSGLPTRDAETIARARDELLAAERLKTLCKKLGLKVPQEAIERVVREEPQHEVEPLRFPSIQQLEAEAAPQAGTSTGMDVPTETGGMPVGQEQIEADIKPDVKPFMQRMATQKHGEKGLLKRFVGQVNDEIIVTHVQPGTDPYQRFDEDHPADMVTLDISTDEEIDLADDLSEVSMVSQGDVTHVELQNLLADISGAHRKMAVAVDALQERVQDMTLEQVDDTAAAVSSEMANIRGISFITEVFNQEEIAIILAVGVRRFQEWQVLKKQRTQGDVTSFARLQEIFGCNARTISECGEVKKYRYTRPAEGRPEGTKEVVKYQRTQHTERQPAGDQPGSSADTSAPQ